MGNGMRLSLRPLPYHKPPQKALVAGYSSSVYGCALGEGGRQMSEPKKHKKTIYEMA